MSLERTMRRRRGDTSKKIREAKRDHRVTGYLITDKGRRHVNALKISGRLGHDLPKG